MKGGRFVSSRTRTKTVRLISLSDENCVLILRFYRYPRSNLKPETCCILGAGVCDYPLQSKSDDCKALSVEIEK